jgi:hypothetical protein
MAEDKLVKVPCQKCGKKLGVRPDQFGRRLRCPACQTAFRVDPPSTAVAKPAPAPRQYTPPPPPEPEEEIFADEAGELVAAGPHRRATATARFHQPPVVVFEATAFAIRRAGGEVLALDRANLHVRFAAGVNGYANEHTVYVFPGPTGGSELDIRATSPGGRADELLYGRIAAELTAYLEAHHAHALATARPAPLSLPPEEPPLPRRQRGRRAEPGDGFAIGGLVLSAIGMVLFCVPIAAIPLGGIGAVLSLVSLSQRKGNRGLAIAGLALGILAVVVSGLFFLVLFAEEVQREEQRRNRFGAVPPVAPWAVAAQMPNQALQRTAASGVGSRGLGGSVGCGCPRPGG